uniref:Uncharacterized protein n=1 Tax=Setaria italica TaxID=4555 RepID=K3ZYV2_SETIT
MLPLLVGASKVAVAAHPRNSGEFEHIRLVSRSNCSGCCSICVKSSNLLLVAPSFLAKLYVQICA